MTKVWRSLVSTADATTNVEKSTSTSFGLSLNDFPSFVLHDLESQGTSSLSVRGNEFVKGSWKKQEGRYSRETETSTRRKSPRYISGTVEYRNFERPSPFPRREKALEVLRVLTQNNRINTS